MIFVEQEIQFQISKSAKFYIRLNLLASFSEYEQGIKCMS